MLMRTAIHPLKMVAALVALVAALAVLLLSYSASPTYAAGDCSTTSGTTACTFASTGSEDTFVVPPGVSSVHVVAIGAPGAVALGGSSAGRGAEVSGNLTVEPGDTLYVEVGGAPTGKNTSDRHPVVDCNGGFNGGGNTTGSLSTFGGGGGGASDVRTVSRAQDGSLASRLIVAGGGGSGHSGACTGTNPNPKGGTGGDAGSDGGRSDDGKGAASSLPPMSTMDG